MSWCRCAGGQWRVSQGHEARRAESNDAAATLCAQRVAERHGAAIGRGGGGLQSLSRRPVLRDARHRRWHQQDVSSASRHSTVCEPPLVCSHRTCQQTRQSSSWAIGAWADRKLICNRVSWELAPSNKDAGQASQPRQVQQVRVTELLAPTEAHILQASEPRYIRKPCASDQGATATFRLRRSVSAAK
jgi:hypothetical protein